MLTNAIHSRAEDGMHATTPAAMFDFELLDALVSLGEYDPFKMSPRQTDLSPLCTSPPQPEHMSLSQISVSPVRRHNTLA